MIDKRRLQGLLKTSLFGEYLYVFPELESSNAYAKNVAQEGAPEGTLVVTDFQTAGRGRRGRIWHSSRGKNILISVVLKPRLSIETVQRITLATASILANALEQFLRREKVNPPVLTLKWPNDVLCGGKKIAGILTESAVKNKTVDYVIVGIGLNVNEDIVQLEEQVQETATSLLQQYGREFDREKLIAHIVAVFEQRYIRLESSNYSDVIEEWKNRCDQIGRTVWVETPVKVEKGTFLDINHSGILMYRTEEGCVKELVAGKIKNEIGSNGING